MPIRYEQDLHQIERDVVTMGSHANEMVRLAVRSAIERDTVLAKNVVAMDDALDQMELDTTEHIVTTLLREAPVAALAGSRRKAITIAFGRLAAMRAAGM